MKPVLKKFVAAILTREARLMLKRHRPHIVVISGSVGKTSTKDAIYSVLHAHVSTRKSQKSFNSEFGVPLTVLNLENGWNNPLRWIWNLTLGCWRSIVQRSYPEWLILEMGTDHPGDMEKLLAWVEPEIAVLTRFPNTPVHVENFESPEKLRKEDFLVAKSLTAGGVVIANGDDEHLRTMLEGFPHRVVRYGLDPGNDVRSEGDSILYADGAVVGMRVMVHGSSITIRGAVGVQHIYPVLAAYAVGKHLGFPEEKLIASLEGHSAPPGRMRLLDGIKNTQLIDDTYNSSPVAAEEALATVSRIETEGRKIAVLGDMLELGKFSKEMHLEIGKWAAETCHMLATVGGMARDIAEGALSNGMDENRVYQFDSSEEAGAFMQNVLKEKDLVLLKGSQGVRMERVTKELMAHPEMAEKLLVRQESEWLKR